MCGIAGIIDVSPQYLLQTDLQKMTDLVAHRGPDDEGMVLFNTEGTGNVVTNKHVEASGPWIAGLGHRRLSIIDLSQAGHQPMRDASGRYWIVYNGEVYNYVEVREELQNLGRVFQSRTDSEVLLQAFIEWGPDCLSRFNGMWALTIYDCYTGTLFCARDRYGIKPFYYAFEKGRFAFASEIKQLLALPWVSRETNRDRLADFFLWGLETHTDETFFVSVRSLPGSHYVILSREDIVHGHFEPQCYWSPSKEGYLVDKQAINAFRDLLSDSVRLRLRSDVPVGVTLSGGLDSSSVICLAGEQRRKSGNVSQLDGFNVEFEGAGYTERHFAEAAANKAGARIIVLRPRSADLSRDWNRFVWHIEEPFSGLTYFSNFQIYRLIREHDIPVVLSGQGGDELLLGYERYRTYDALFKLKTMQPIEAFKEIIAARIHANMSFGMQFSYALYFYIPLLREVRRRYLVHPILKRDFYQEYKGQSGQLYASMIHRDRESLQQSEMFHYQLPHLLRHEDRLSMAHSVETRLPFLDYRLLELVLGQPTNLLFRDGWSKYILRQAMEGILPKEVQKRTDKMGFDTPTGGLIRSNREMFMPLLARHRNDKILDISSIERLFEFEKLDHRILCSALSYLSWKETFSVS